MFPIIRTIDDVLPHIKDYPEFFIADKEGYRVINYMVSGPNSFGSGDLSYSDMVRRECRGLMFDYAGNIIRRPLHKFMNIGQTDEVRPENIDITQNHNLLTKLDGSMISPFVLPRNGFDVNYGGNVRLGTKMGITDVSLKAEEYIKDKIEYQEFIDHYVSMDHTPIFEFIAPDNRIVIAYDKPELVLLAMRHINTGEYIPYHILEIICKKRKIPLVKRWQNFSDINTLLSHTASLKNEEGYVIAFDSGIWCKIKADEYCRIHKAKDEISSEKNVLQLIFNENLDDVLPHLYEEDQTKLKSFEEKLLEHINILVLHLYHHLNFITEKYSSKKEYALNIAKTSKPNEKYLDTIAFNVYDKSFTVQDIRIELINYIKKNLSSSSKIDGIRHILGDNKWDYYKVIDD